MQDTHHHSARGRNRQDAFAAIVTIENQCAALLETFPEPLRHTGFEEAVLLLRAELETIDPDQLAACDEGPPHAAGRDASFGVPGRIAVDTLPLAEVAVALARSGASRTVTGSSRISLHGQRFHDHARGVLGRGAVGLVCHWLDCSPRDAVRFLDTDETLIAFQKLPPPPAGAVGTGRPEAVGLRRSRPASAGRSGPDKAPCGRCSPQASRLNSHHAVRHAPAHAAAPGLICTAWEKLRAQSRPNLQTETHRSNLERPQESVTTETGTKAISSPRFNTTRAGTSSRSSSPRVTGAPA